MSDWTTHVPTACGLYVYRCGELDYKPHHAAVFVNSDGVLMVDDSGGAGVVRLEYFHEDLSNIEWKKV